MKNETFLVYVHTCNINGKKYVGMTVRTLEQRSGRNGNGYYKNKEFYADIKLYGWDNITHEVLEDDLSEEEAQHLEQYYIALWQTDNPEFGYNRSKGGEKPAMLGKKHSPKTKRKQSEIKIGKYAGENNPMYGKYGENSPNFGKKRTKEQRERKSKSMKGNQNTKGHHWYNNGDTELLAFECPDGFTQGRLQYSEEHKHKISGASKERHWYNNGIENKFVYECPAGFVPGMLKRA